MREENVLKYFPDIPTAADLIDQSSNSWKKELIKRISHFSSAKKILSNSNDLHNCARIYHFSSAKEYSL